MNTDSLIPVANAIHSSPKRYTLILGAGISVSAGLPTAGDASGNMIRKIAAGKDDDLENVIPGGKKTEVYLEWFEKQFDNKATFELLMHELGISEGNRKDGLKEFIYRKDADGNLDSGTPTDAHRSIARLVKSGMISLIITTNFDTLLEDALREENVRYDVITEESDVKQMSVIPDRCRILKVNGDFEKGTLRITPEDLKKYPEEIEDYLRRIFAEYGLVICGWSGIFDTHLSEILCADDITRRYPAFWCLRDKSVVPSAVCQTISLARIEIDNADCFFTNLEVVLERFSRFEPTTTLSAAAAVKKVKDALRDPRPDLSVPDVINSEADRVVHALKDFEFYPLPEGEVIAKDHLRSVLVDLERITAPLAAMCAALAYYEDGMYRDGMFSRLISMTIERLFAIDKPNREYIPQFRGAQSGTEFIQCLEELRFYPAVLVIYASGIAAVQNMQLSNLNAVLFEPTFRDNNGFTHEKKPYFDYINLWMTVFYDENLIAKIALDKFGNQVKFYNYAMEILKVILQPVIPYELAVQEAFDVFEFLSSIAYIQTCKPDLLQCEPKNPPWPLRSRVWDHYFGFRGSKKINLYPHILEYCNGIGDLVEESLFFNGNSIDFEECNRIYAKFFGITAPETGIPYVDDFAGCFT